MNKQIMILIFAVTVSPLAFGTTNSCKNHAKYAAIKAYKAEMGTVQGSDGIECTETLLKKQGKLAKYKVTISDNNEDGETWDVDYLVQIHRGSACKILNVQKMDAEIASQPDFAEGSLGAPHLCKKEAENRAVEVFTSNGEEFTRDLELVSKFNTVFSNKIHWNIYVMKDGKELAAYGIGLSLLSPKCRALSVVDLNYHSDWE